MLNLNLNSKKVLIISIVLLLVVTGSLIYYYNNQIKELNTKILVLNNVMVSDLKELRQDLTKDISSLDDNLTMEIGFVDSDLRNFKTRNKKDINTLNTLIDEIEEQTEIQLGELKDELKSIRVKSKDFTAIIDYISKM